MTKPVYKWTPPMYWRGDTVDFYDWRDNLQTGEVVFLKTSYDRDGVASHTYGMHIGGRRRNIYVGEDRIIPAARSPKEEHYDGPASPLRARARADKRSKSSERSKRRED